MDKKLPAPLAKATAKAVGKSLGKGFQNINPVAFLPDILKFYSDVQHEKTEQARIEAKRQTQLAEIEAKTQLFLDYLDRAFAERAENFRRLFGAVDVAMACGNNEQLGLALHGITELAKTTPFKDLVDMRKTQELLTDPNHEWKL